MNVTNWRGLTAWVLVACSSACVTLTPQQRAAIEKTMEPQTVRVSGTRGEAFTAAMRGVASSGLQIGASDRDAGLVQTAKTQTYPDGTTAILLGTQFTRQLSFTITADDGTVRVAPHVEICNGATGGSGTCKPDVGLRENEQQLMASLVSAIGAQGSYGVTAAVLGAALVIMLGLPKAVSGADQRVPANA